jgi:uncharacterized damage-inducible protein DinB
MFDYSKNNLKWVVALLQELPDGIYDRPSALLSHATIGQHVRHIVEMYQGLLSGYDSGTIEYDKRKRERRIETERAFAEETLNEIIAKIKKADKPLTVVYELDGGEVSLQSNYEREVMYNMEHAIHHMALIKVAVIEMTDITLPKEFGVAPTTLQYRAQCVQ